MEDNSEDDDDDDIISQPMIYNALARESIQNLQRYFIEQGFDDQHKKPYTCAEGIFRSFVSSLYRKQTTIDNYFLNFCYIRV